MPSLTPAYIVRVVDGDTIRVRIEEKEYTVRLIGMDAPESVDPRKPVQCFGKEASVVLAELIGGKQVWLAPDDTQDEKDRYGRLLRYVYLDDDTNVAEYMIRNGFAFEYTYREPYRYQKLFRQAQASAEYEAVGLWAPDACSQLEKPEE
jgi:micrococcal nuclease